MSEIDLMLHAIAECFCDHYCVLRNKCKDQDELYELCYIRCPFDRLNHEYKGRLDVFNEELEEMFNDTEVKENEL